MKRGTAWLSSTCRMETKWNEDGWCYVQTMWFIWPRERTSMWSYLLLLHFKRTRNPKSHEKSQQKIALLFERHVKLHETNFPKKTRNVSISAIIGYPARQLRRLSTSHSRTAVSAHTMATESKAPKTSACETLCRKGRFRPCFGVFLLVVNTRKWGFKLWREERWCKTLESKLKNSRKNSIRQNPPPQHSRLISFSNVSCIFGYLPNICSDENIRPAWIHRCIPV